MVALVVFFAHVIAAAALFTKRWQEGDVKEGVLSVGFLVLVFAVGWSMSTFVMKLFVEEAGLAEWLDRDAMSLLFLALAEALFFSVQMRRKARRSLSGPAT